jgi:PKD repeat protein
MKKQLSTLALGIALSLSFSGQSQSQRIQPCNTYAAMDEYFDVNPASRKLYDQNQELLQNLVNQKAQQNVAGKTAATVYTVPVVFHILHMGGAENVSDATVMSALNQVNSDFAKLGADANTVAAPFANLYVDSEIKLVLAKKDPNGNCTSGIIHRYDTRTDWSQGNISTNYIGLTWDPTKYLNVIVVKQIIPTGTVTGGGIIVGYTYKPGTWPTGALQDAIIYNYGFLTGLNNQRSLTHEVGHWFNLPHTFGNTNNPGVSCGDDAIADTPPTKGNFSSCPSSLSGNTCHSSGTHNVENIMDYSSCPKNFTQGQTTVMRTSLESTISGRSNLWSATNHVFTNINSTAECAPIAEFLSTTNSYTVCSGGSLTLRDYSYNGSITSYSWSGNANFANSTASLTSATFLTPGTATVSLTVANATGSSVKTRTIIVLDGTPGANPPYFESFEANPLPTGWSIQNLNAGSVTWAHTNAAAYDGANSYFINGSLMAGNQTDILEMPIIDLLNNPTDTLTFKYAYARKNSTHNDIFKVEMSGNCGGTWTTVFNPSAAAMASGSGGVSTSPFFPSLAQWKHVNLNIYPYFGNFLSFSSVKVRFSFTEAAGGTGNNIFLDAINFSGSPVGINELAKSISFRVFPNPSGGETTVKFSLQDAAVVKVELLDILGRVIIPSEEVNYTSGDHSVTFNTNNELGKGIYFVNLSHNGTKVTKKLIIK